MHRGENVAEAESRMVAPILPEPATPVCTGLKYSASPAPNKELTPMLFPPNGVEYSLKVVLTAAQARPNRPGDDLESTMTTSPPGTEVTEGHEKGQRANGKA